MLNRIFPFTNYKTKFNICNLCHILFKRLYQHINLISFLAIGTYFRYYLSWDRWTSRQGNGLTNQQKYLYFFFLGSILWFLPFNHWRSTTWLGSSEKVDISMFDFRLFINYLYNISNQGYVKRHRVDFLLYFCHIYLVSKEIQEGILTYYNLVYELNITAIYY